MLIETSAYIFASRPLSVWSRRLDLAMADLEQQLKASVADARRGYADASQHNYLNLSRSMETEEEEQFDVDLTILDFLVYKATGLIFEWTSSNDRYNSDLPDALVNMTAGSLRSGA